MKLSRITYRITQFWNALRTRPASTDLEWALSKLSTAQIDLFTQLHRSEQVHSISVLKKIVQNEHANFDEDDQAIIVAALLHDVGKTLYPLAIWERVLVVLSKTLFPKQVRQWGRGQPTGWRRAFVIAEQHPEWGAQLVARTDASPLTVELIRLHQSPNPENTDNHANARLGNLLLRLQVADKDS